VICSLSARRGWRYPKDAANSTDEDLLPFFFLIRMPVEFVEALALSRYAM
jgi:hypothetical protein